MSLAAAPGVAQPVGLGRIPFPLPGTNRPPTPAEREFSAGDALLQRGELDAARPRFEAARRLDPRDARPVFYLGEVALRQDHDDVAEPLFREALRLNPGMAEAHAELGAMLHDHHQDAAAVPELEAALRLSPSLGEAHHTLALCLQDRGDPVRAVSEYRSAVRLLADDPLPPLHLGVMLAGQHPGARTAPYAEAVRSLEEAARRAPRDVEVLSAVGPALRALGEYRAAADVLERARAQGHPTAPLLGELAQALWAAGDRGAAEQRITEAIALAPREPSLRYVHALMLAGVNATPRATMELREVVRLAPGTPLAERAGVRLRELGAATAP